MTEQRCHVVQTAASQLVAGVAADGAWCALLQRLDAAVTELAGDRAQTAVDDALLEVLLALYDRTPEMVWNDVTGPWIAARWDLLQVVYAEHDALSGDTGLLDLAYALLLLERLEHDRARVIVSWPYDLAELEKLQDVWGTRLLP